MNTLFTQLDAATSQATRNSISEQIDMLVMKDAVFLPAVYSKALLYRSPAADQRLRAEVLRDVQLPRTRHEALAAR